jgi:hypothetical protein
MINSVLRPYKIYARYYIDDIVIFFKIFKNYIEYFDKIFNLFDTLNITLKRLKTYFEYLLIIVFKKPHNRNSQSRISDYFKKIREIS